MRNRIVRRNRRRAFTLLEVLMVIVILGVIAAAVVYQLGGTQDRALTDQTRNQIKTLANSTMELFKMHTGTYPSQMKDLIERPDDEAIAEKWAEGGYVRELPKDAWGRELKYRFPGTVNEKFFDLYSVGKDGVEGTDDDIGNWDKQR